MSLIQPNFNGHRRPSQPTSCGSDGKYNGTMNACKGLVITSSEHMEYVSKRLCYALISFSHHLLALSLFRLPQISCTSGAQIFTALSLSAVTNRRPSMSNDAAYMVVRSAPCAGTERAVKVRAPDS